MSGKRILNRESAKVWIFFFRKCSMYYSKIFMTESGMFVTAHPRLLGIMLAMDRFICPGAQPGGTKPKDFPTRATYLPKAPYFTSSPFIQNEINRKAVFATIDTQYIRTTQDNEILAKAQAALHDGDYLRDEYYPNMLKFFNTLVESKQKLHVNQYQAYTIVHHKKYNWSNNGVKIVEPSLHISTWAALVTQVMLSKFNPPDAHAEFIACCCIILLTYLFDPNSIFQIVRASA